MTTTTTNLGLEKDASGTGGPGYWDRLQANHDRLDSASFANVKARGAALDGVADDTSDIQDTIDAVSAAGGGTVLINRGTGNHTGLTLPAEVRLLGEDKFATTLNVTDTGTAITVTGNKAAICDLRLTGNTAGTGHLVDVDATANAVDLSWFRMENVSLEGWGNNASAIHLKGSSTNAGHSVYFAYLANVDVFGNVSLGHTQTGVHIEHGTLSGVNRGSIVGGNVRSCTVGVHIDSSDGWMVSVNNYENNATAIKLTGSVSRVTQANVFIGFVCEDSSTRDIDVGTNCNDNFFFGHAVTKQDTNAPSRNHYFLSGTGNMQWNRPATFSDQVDFTKDGLAFTVSRAGNAPAFDVIRTGAGARQWRHQVDGSGNYVLTDVTGATNRLILAPTVPTVTGSRGGNAALADLLTELANMGLIIDSSS